MKNQKIVDFITFLLGVSIAIKQRNWSSALTQLFLCNLLVAWTTHSYANFDWIICSFEHDCTWTTNNCGQYDETLSAVSRARMNHLIDFMRFFVPLLFRWPLCANGSETYRLKEVPECNLFYVSQEQPTLTLFPNEITIGNSNLWQVQHAFATELFVFSFLRILCDFIAFSAFWGRYTKRFVDE